MSIGGLLRPGRTTGGIMALAFVLAGGIPPSAAAQVIHGRVVDQIRENGIGDASVQLMTRDGESVAQTLSDAMGRFTVAPPGAGEYYLFVEGLGYHTTTSPLLALRAEGEVNLDVTMMPKPIGLEGLAVQVDVGSLAAEQLTIAGIDPKNLGNGWITEAEIDAIEVKRDIGNLLEWAGTPSIRVIRSENMTKGENGEGDDTGLCFAFSSARTFLGEGRCALIVLDGRRISGEAATYLDPYTIGQAAVLRPIDARILFGTAGDAGAVMFWTKRGRPRR